MPSMNESPGVLTSEEVADALAAGQPVVGLETAVLTHGLPREPRNRPSSLDPDHEAGRLLGDVLASDAQAVDERGPRLLR